MTEFKRKSHEVDLCVVGGGMAGLCAAISAARHGAKVVLMHDRPVFGGNASSECRVHICGADVHNHNTNMRETGILEEFRMENLYRNPNRNFSIWDTILYETVFAEPNITALLNCSCLNAEMDGEAIRTVTGWQLTTQTYHNVNARIFADCSGDAILAPLTGVTTGWDARHARNTMSQLRQLRPTKERWA
jgi:UDP-galactopyranose mutase